MNPLQDEQRKILIGFPVELARECVTGVDDRKLEKASQHQKAQHYLEVLWLLKEAAKDEAGEDKGHTQYRARGHVAGIEQVQEHRRDQADGQRKQANDSHGHRLTCATSCTIVATSTIQKSTATMRRSYK
jgi:hypothetical protein